jgi:hypothetical protein
MSGTEKALLLAHVVHSDEGFEASAHMIIDMINAAGKKSPGKPRILVLDIEGHRNEKGGFDDEMVTLQHGIIQQMLTPWLDEVQMPLIHYRVSGDRRRGDEELPIKLMVKGDEVQLYSES